VTLSAAIVRDGAVVTDRFGQPRVHAAVNPLTTATAALNRALSQLGLPAEDGSVMPSAEQRRNVRGAEAQRALRTATHGSVSDMARAAAHKRWHPDTA
jgi:hypothetical protein